MQLLPRDVKFYEFFLRQAEMVRDAAAVFRAGLESGKELRVMCEQITELERRGDEIEHEIYRRLHKTFITPIDPEDVHSFASGLDDIIDGFESTAYRVVAYGTKPNEPLREISRYLDAAAGVALQVFDAMNRRGLEQVDYIGEQVIELNRLEEACERVAREAVAHIFAEEKNAIALLCTKEIYEHCEAIGDRFETLADRIENVLAKNS